MIYLAPEWIWLSPPLRPRGAGVKTSADVLILTVTFWIFGVFFLGGSAALALPVLVGVYCDTLVESKHFLDDILELSGSFGGPSFTRSAFADCVHTTCKDDRYGLLNQFHSLFRFNVQRFNINSLTVYLLKKPAISTTSPSSSMIPSSPPTGGGTST